MKIVTIYATHLHASFSKSSLLYVYCIKGMKGVSEKMVQTNLGH